ncbi:MAG: hypothetical protein QOC81_673 [Thermoanaerobaculia bacterium]|jgi:hypothetical protein|nr:hypothetical protein [Thermoanaerobaculia bacterium]
MTLAETAPDTFLAPETRDFYIHSMKLMRDGGVPFLVGGAYAFARYTGIERHTKDFDVFIRREDFPKAKKVFEAAGYRSELNFPHWLGKAIKGDDFVDLIFSAGNGVAVVDELWFDFAVDEKVFGVDVKLIPAEEMIWSKGLIMERERFDGADVAHVILATGHRLDWRRLLDRYGKLWRALYAHLVLFGFTYPSNRSQVPAWVMTELSGRIAEETNQPDAAEKICYGTIISRQQYLTDINKWGYQDGRLRPIGNMSAEEIAHWTAGIEVDGSK